MFTLVPDPTFNAPVQLTVPGHEQPASLVLTFAAMGRKAFKGWMAQAAAVATITDDDQRNQAEAQWLSKAVLGWPDPADGGPVLPDGSPAPYSVQALAQLLDTYPDSGPEILAAYQRALFEARAKN